MTVTIKGVVRRLYFDLRAQTIQVLETVDFSADTQEEFIRVFHSKALDMYQEQVSNGLWEKGAENDLKIMVRLLRRGETDCTTLNFSVKVQVDAPGVWIKMD